MRSFIALALAATAFAARQAPPEDELVEEVFDELKNQGYDNVSDTGAAVDDWNDSDTDNYQSFDHRVDVEWLEASDEFLQSDDAQEAHGWLAAGLLGSDGAWNLAREAKWSELINIAKE